MTRWPMALSKSPKSTRQRREHCNDVRKKFCDFEKLSLLTWDLLLSVLHTHTHTFYEASGPLAENIPKSCLAEASLPTWGKSTDWVSKMNTFKYCYNIVKTLGIP